MLNATPITLRNEAVYLRELTIGEVIEIAKIPEQMNELRLNAFLSYVCDDNTLPYRLTVQERYYILLNYLTVSQSHYIHNEDILPYLIESKHCDDFAPVGNVYVKPIFGNEISTLQKVCENAYEWLAGQMVFGIYGDVGNYFASDEPMIWADTRLMNDNELDSELKNRFEVIHQLPQSQFETLYELYEQGQSQLSHLVDVGNDNHGITLVGKNLHKQKEEDSDFIIARFHPFKAVSDIAGELIFAVSELNHQSHHD